MKKVKYVLPGFLNLGLNEILINIYETHSYVTREDTCIYSFFGSFPKAIWNGGRIDNQEFKSNTKFMKKVRDFYNKKGIHLALTFTNPVLEEKHLHDEYCNQIMEIFDNGMNEVLVNSPILEKYIREKWPNFKISRSITAVQYEPYKTKNYHLSVIAKEKNKDFEYLKKFPDKDKEKIEILCNETCINNCKFTYKHYEEIGKRQLGYKSNDPNYGMCKHIGIYPHYKFWAMRNKFSDFYISPEDIIEKYIPLGFQYFKICGREKYVPYGLISIVEYCIKPEYQMDVMTYIQERIILESKEERNYYLTNVPEYSKNIEDRNWRYV